MKVKVFCNITFNDQFRVGKVKKVSFDYSCNSVSAILKQEMPKATSSYMQTDPLED